MWKTILTWVKFFSTLIPDINTRLLHLFWNFQSFMIFSFYLMKLEHAHFVLSLFFSTPNRKYSLQVAWTFPLLPWHMNSSLEFFFCSVLFSLNLKSTHYSLFHSIEHLFCFCPWFFNLILATSNKCPAKSTSMHFWFSKWISIRMWKNRGWCWSQASLGHWENTEFAKRPLFFWHFIFSEFH